jgi:hypothetical protein
VTDNHWDSKGHRQKLGESLRNYIRCFSWKCHELSKVGDTDIISTFWFNNSYQTLVHEFGHHQPKTMKELLDIATRHASGEKVAGAVFIQDNGKTLPDGS